VRVSAQSYILNEIVRLANSHRGSSTGDRSLGQDLSEALASEMVADGGGGGGLQDEEEVMFGLSQESVLSQPFFHYPVHGATSLSNAVDDTPARTRRSSSQNDPLGGSDGTVLEKEDLVVEKMRIHYGMGSANPVSKVRFFTKSQRLGERDTERESSSNSQGDDDFLLPVGREVPESNYESRIPKSFEELAVRVFCKFPDKVELARKGFELWCQLANLPTPFPSLPI